MKAADVLLKILNGSMYPLRLARVSLPVVPNSAQSGAFLQQAINALSDSFFYTAPVFLQLDDFTEVKASVFQMTRAPGKASTVYLGCLLLVLGACSRCVYIRERRVCWLWACPGPGPRRIGREAEAAVLAPAMRCWPCPRSGVHWISSSRRNLSLCATM
ncbi:cytochrome c biogenesis protein ResB [Cupriavidus basilensis]